MEQFHGMSDGNINISDVIEVIQTTDPGFVEANGREDQGPVEMSSGRLMPYVEIVEQPASKALRFRYECEGRSAGSIPGVNSMPENKTFPSIRIVGYKGRAVVVVSCVTKDPPHRPHPHNLVGKEACKQGICKVEVSSENMTVTFANLGIQCVKKKDIEEALRVREEIRVDPFRTGFDHKKQPTSIDLNAVRLCFQVFLEGTPKGKFIPLQPVVSDPIFDKKAMSDLVICKLSHCSASVAGGMEMILLCEKVAKEDIQVRFFEEKDGQVVWEGFGDFQPTHVHKQTAIAFRTPSYRIQQVEQPVQVYIQLKRPSDNAMSEPLPFQMLPLGTDDPDSLRRKRQKFNNSPNALVLRHVQAEAEKHATMLNQPIQYNFNIIKPEPAERVSPYGGAVATGGTFPLYPVGTSPQVQSNMQTLRPQVSPGRTPSPMEYKAYNPPLMPSQLSPQYQPQNTHMIQPSSTGAHFQQQFSYAHQQQSLNQPVDQLVLNRITPDYQNVGLQPLVNPGDITGADMTSVLDMDSQQYSFDLSLNQIDSAELAAFGAPLAENLSSGLSLSDATKPEINKVVNMETSNVGGCTSTDSLTRLTNSAIQELCTLSSMYKSTRGNEN